MSGPQILAAVIAAFVVTQLAIFTTTVFLHRGLTHRALTMHPIAAFPCRLVIWVTTGMRPREWVAVHRKHHAATDTAEDPHSPLVVGFWRVQLGNVGLYKRAARDDEMVRKYARDIPTDRFDRLAFDYSLVGLGIGVTLLVVVMWVLGFGLLTGFVAAGMHAVLYVMLAGAINAVGHRYGSRPYESSATNLKPLALVTGGEGLHNNHHAAPTSARFSLHRGEIDPGWWVVKVLVALHLAHVRHEDVHLKRGGVDPRVAVYVAMLRGINVGAHNRIKMPALVELFTGLGHTDVVTYIQSGNVVFKSRSKSPHALERAIEQRIRRDLGCDVAVLIRTKNELATIVRANPFLAAKADTSHLHVTFLAEVPDPELVRAVEEFDAGADEVRVVGRDVYLHTPGGYGNTKLNGALIEKRLRAVSTTRNWNSVTKLLELAG